jgi:hypothetical protein
MLSNIFISVLIVFQFYIVIKLITGRERNCINTRSVIHVCFTNGNNEDSPWVNSNDFV